MFRRNWAFKLSVGIAKFCKMSVFVNEYSYRSFLSWFSASIKNPGPMYNVQIYKFMYKFIYRNGK